MCPLPFFDRWEEDTLKRDFAPRKVPLVPPTTAIDDEPNRCVIINASWVSHVIGVLETLIQRDSWLGTNEEIYTAQQQIEQLMSSLATESCPVPTQLRVVNCQLQIFNEETEAWDDVAGAAFVRLDGSCPMTGNLDFAPAGAIRASIDVSAGSDVRFGATSNHPVYLIANNQRKAGVGGDGRGMIGATAINTSVQAQWHVFSTSNGRVALIAQGASGQTASLFEARDSNANALALITAAGRAQFREQALLRGLSSVQERDMALFEAVWAESTDATRKAQFVVYAYDAGGAREVVRGGANGSAATIGFLGATPVTRRTVTGEYMQIPALDSLLQALAAEGLITNSTTAGSLPAGPQGPAGPAGPQGEQGLPGADGTCLGDCVDSPTIEGNENDLSGQYCSIANYVVEWLDAKFNDLLDSVDATGSTASALALVLPIFGPIGIAVAAVVLALDSVRAAGTANIRAAVTAEVIEDAKCQLYCLIANNSGWSTDLIFTWRDQVYANSGANLGLQEWIKTVNNFDTSIWDQRAYIGSLATSTDCAACDECEEPTECSDVSFIGSRGGYTVISGDVGQWFNGQGWGTVESPAEHQRLAISRDCDGFSAAHCNLYWHQPENAVHALQVNIYRRSDDHLFGGLDYSQIGSPTGHPAADYVTPENTIFDIQNEDVRIEIILDTGNFAAIAGARVTRIEFTT